MAEVKVISKKKKLIAAFIIMLILVFLFNRAMYWTEFSTWKNKVLVAVISLAGVIVVPLFLTYVKSVSDYIDMFISNKIKQIKALKDNWEKVLLYTALFVVIIVAAVLLEKLILSRVYGGYSYLRMYFCMSTGILIFALVLCGKIAYKRVEVVFAVAALIMGLTYIMVSPRHLLVTWDDETHYLRSVSLADVFDNTKFNAEGSFYDSQPATYMYTQGDLTKEEFDAILSNVEYEYSQKYTNNRFTSEVGKEFVAYIPAAVGIIMGKALGLSFFQTFLFSKMVILCTYVMLMYFAIKKLKNGKTIYFQYLLRKALDDVSIPYIIGDDNLTKYGKRSGITISNLYFIKSLEYKAVVFCELEMLYNQTINEENQDYQVNDFVGDLNKIYMVMNRAIEYLTFITTFNENSSELIKILVNSANK